MATAVVVLTGCGPNPALYARLESDEVAILICQVYENPSLTVHAGAVGTMETRRVWEIESTRATTAGDQVILGRAPNGWTEELPLAETSWRGLALTVGLFEARAGGAGSYATAEFVPDRMAPGQWYQSGGSPATPSCDSSS